MSNSDLSRANAKKTNIRASKNDANQVVIVGAGTVVHLRAATIDRLGEWNTATWRFTPTRSGNYLIIASVEVTYLAGANQSRLTIRRSGVQWAVRDFQITGAGTFYFEVSTILDILPTQFIDIYFINLAGANQTILNSAANNVVIARLS